VFENVYVKDRKLCESSAACQSWARHRQLTSLVSFTIAPRSGERPFT
jgi:hypothetical protein